MTGSSRVGCKWWWIHTLQKKWKSLSSLFIIYTTNNSYLESAARPSNWNRRHAGGETRASSMHMRRKMTRHDLRISWRIAGWEVLASVEECWTLIRCAHRRLIVHAISRWWGETCNLVSWPIKCCYRNKHAKYKLIIFMHTLPRFIMVMDLPDFASLSLANKTNLSSTAGSNDLLRLFCFFFSMFYK